MRSFKPGDSMGSEAQSLNGTRPGRLVAWVGPQLSGGSRTLMALGHFLARSRAPAESKRIALGVGKASQNEACGRREQREQQQKNAKL